MVRTIWAGILANYALFIANIGIRVPQTYTNWKDHVLIMYKECQKKWVYNQMHGMDQHGDKKSGNQKQITATSSNKNTAGGTTSSSTSKVMGQGQGRKPGTGR